MTHARTLGRRTPWWAWPMVLLWRTVTWAANLMGIAAALGIGLVLMLIGALLIQSVVGFFLGAPLFILGLLLVIRGLY